MYGVVRNYSGAGAVELFDRIEQHESEVRELIRSVSGFVSYSLIRTVDGGVTVTICTNKEGADASSRIARDWVQENASDLDLRPPAISEGQVAISVG